MQIKRVITVEGSRLTSQLQRTVSCAARAELER